MTGMPLLLLALLLAVVLAGAGCRKKEPQTTPVKFAAIETPAAAKSHSRADLKRKLLQLANSKPPKELAIGAMCYEMMAPPARQEYVCPVCGEKTLYATADSEEQSPDRKVPWDLVSRVGEDIPASRRLIGTIPDIKARLDEKQFCKECSPNTASPVLILEIRYPDESEAHRIEGVSAFDIQILNEFLTGKTKHKQANDGEVPLQKHTKRLEQLLGVKVEE